MPARYEDLLSRTVALGLLAFMLTGRFVAWPITTFLLFVMAEAIHRGAAQRGKDIVVPGILRLVGWWQTRKEDEVVSPWDIPLGHEPGSHRPVVENLVSLGSVGIYATTQNGKTSLLYATISHLITHLSPAHFRMIIVDPEEFDYRIFQNIPHLELPIARNREEALRVLRWVQKEMSRRGDLFRQVPKKYLCNSIERYHSLNERYRLKLPDLPVLLVVIDEVQKIAEAGSDAEKILIDLAKRGQKRGMLLWAATQRPTSDVMSGHIKSQLTARMIGHMSSKSDYHLVHNVPKEVYTQMEEVPGRFMLQTNKWTLFQGRWVPKDDLEAIALRVSRNVPAPSWDKIRPETLPEINEKRPWAGSNESKTTRLKAWLMQYTEKPDVSEVIAHWDMSEPTGRKWLNEVWPDVAKEKGLVQ